MTRFRNANHVRIFDYPKFAEPLRDRVRERAALLAAEAGIAIRHVRPRPQGSDCRRGAGTARRASRPGACYLGDGELRRL